MDTDIVVYSVKRFAVDIVGPKVREMDEKESMDPTIIQGLFEQGVSIRIFSFQSVLTSLCSSWV